MTPPPSPLWRRPWRFQESVAIIIGLSLTGFALQLAAGPFDFSLLAAPRGYVAVGLTAVIFLWGKLRPRSAWLAWLGGAPLAVSLIAALLLFSLIMGLTPQSGRLEPPGAGPIAALGLTRLTSAWPFVLLYTLTLLALTGALARRRPRLRVRDLAFYANHLGLLLLMLAAGLGAADLRRLVMHVREGETEWRVFNERGDVLELPVAVTLHDFLMEEYPPKLLVINRADGQTQPPDATPALFSLDSGETRGALLDWDITLERYIHQAVKSDGEYRESPMPASTPAALVLAKNRRTGQLRRGWVCAGGPVPEFFAGLILDESLMLVMSRPEPKYFASDITAMTQQGAKVKTRLEVNRPLRLGHWSLYQYSYDAAAGKMSSYSSLELVYDPWLGPVYAGLILMALGALGLMAGPRSETDAK